MAAHGEVRRPPVGRFGGRLWGESHGRRHFTTQTPGPFALPDARQWEMVSPPDKHGALLTTNFQGEYTFQAAAAGGAMTYHAGSPIEAQPQGFADTAQVLSTRGPQGWRSLDLEIPHGEPTGAALGEGSQYKLFSRDLSFAALQPMGSFEPSLSAQASEQTPYLRTDYPSGEPDQPCLQSCYRPLVTGQLGYANVPEGTQFADKAECEFSAVCGPRFLAATPDLRHVVLSSNVPLTSTGGNLYEWSADRPAAEQLQSVSVLPESEGGGAIVLGSLGARDRRASALSEDGSRVVWHLNCGGDCAELFMRDTLKGETVELDAAEPQCVSEGKCGGGGGHFGVASSDGSRVFFTSEAPLTQDAGARAKEPDLYECEMIVDGAGKLQCELTDLTPLSAGERANVQGKVLGASEDGSRVYFVADGVLAAGAEHGQPNLYVRSEGMTKLVAVLSPADHPDWTLNSGVLGIVTMSARVSSEGRWLAFMSQRNLTGYDSRDLRSGHPDEQVYLYDAGSGRLLCASCAPSGGRPDGTEFVGEAGATEEGFLGGNRTWAGEGSSLAAIVPGWTTASYQSRYLSDSGRLFFDSHDALVPQDANGTWDVYQYEPPGVGGCAASSPTFSERSGGCVGLISSGASGRPSAFLDASESGDDVFFLTNAQLSPQDADTSLDLYDAHVCSAAAPCLPPPPPPQPVCEGDACQSPAVPPLHPTPGTSLLNGPGNVLECSKGKVKQGGKCVAKKSKKHPKRHKKKNHGKHKRSHRAARHNRGGVK